MAAPVILRIPGGQDPRTNIATVQVDVLGVLIKTARHRKQAESELIFAASVAKAAHASLVRTVQTANTPGMTSLSTSRLVSTGDTRLQITIGVTLDSVSIPLAVGEWIEMVLDRITNPAAPNEADRLHGDDGAMETLMQTSTPGDDPFGPDTAMGGLGAHCRR